MEIIFPSRLYYIAFNQDNYSNPSTIYASGDRPYPGYYILQAVDGERKEPIVLKDYISSYRGPKRHRGNPCLHVKYTTDSMLGYDSKYLGPPYVEFQDAPYHVNTDMPVSRLKPKNGEYNVKALYRLDNNLWVSFDYYYFTSTWSGVLRWEAHNFQVTEWHYENNVLYVDYWGGRNTPYHMTLQGRDAQDLGLEWVRETMPAAVLAEYKTWLHNYDRYITKFRVMDCSDIPYNPNLVNWFPSPSQFLQYGEASISLGKGSAPRGGGDPANRYDFKLAQQTCFLEAIRKLPVANQNSIQNLVELVSILKFILDLKKGKISTSDFKASLKSSLKPNNAWLKYRYMYGTGKMDAEEYLKYIAGKQMMLHTKDTAVSHRVNMPLGQMNVNIIVENHTDNMIANAWRMVHELGLEVNPYVLWDFLPYSFVVDWAYPIGDILSRISDSYLINDNVYHYKSICYSLKYKATTEMPLGEFEAQVYARWYESGSPYLDSSYWFDESLTHDPSKVTIIKRVIDAGALLVGHFI